MIWVGLGVNPWRENEPEDEGEAQKGNVCWNPY